MKMLCRDIFNHAKADLKYDTPGGVSEIESIDKDAVTVVNHVYCDIYFKIYDEGFNPLNSVYDKIDLPENIIFKCLIPGVAAKIAFDYGDSKNQAYFSSLYNQGLRELNSTSTQIEDVLPSNYLGG